MTKIPSSDDDNECQNPCQLVRTSCAEFYKQSIGQYSGDDIPITTATTTSPINQQQQPYVKINQSAIRIVAQQIVQQQQAPVEWDEENWHYNLMKGDVTNSCWSPEIRFERTAASILALDAINFCFWTDNSTTTNSTGTTSTTTNNTSNNAERFEYEHMAIALKGMASEDHDDTTQSRNIDIVAASKPSFIFSPSNMAKMTKNEMIQLFKRQGSRMVPPNMEDRVRMWNHIGTVLMEQFDGSVTKLIQLADRSAPRLVQLLIEYFPNCFGGDYITTTMDGHNSSSTKVTTHFYKRAQICIGDWNSALQLNLYGMDELTMFADYRVPQILRHLNVLEYSTELATLIDNYIVLSIGSMEEVSIRAATVTAVEWLVQELNSNQHASASSNNHIDDDSTECKTASNINDKRPSLNDQKWTPLVTDWYLWQLGERMMNENKLAPHHRVRTIYY